MHYAFYWFLLFHSLEPFSCTSPGLIVKSPPSQITTVEEVCILLSCSVWGTVVDSIYSSWNVSNCPSSHDQQCEVTNIHDNSSSQYHIYVYDLPDLTSCIFFNQLIIFNVSEEQNNTDYTCIESIDKNGIQPIFPQDNTTSRLSKYYKLL